MRHSLYILLFLFLSIKLSAQTSIDAIIAIIGKEIILQSDLEKSYAEYSKEFAVHDGNEEDRCSVFENLVYTKIMLHQADVDSIIITDVQVEASINQRMNYFLQMTGGDPKVIERHFGKTIPEIKKDMREQVRDQMFVEQVQESLTEKVSVTPSEVKAFVKKFGVDSMPQIPATYEFGHILVTPEVKDEEIVAIKARLESYRDRVLRGEKFAGLARLYSDDPGSASKGGNLGFVERGVLYPEFEAVAFNLKSGEISNVIKTRAGYHIIQLVERRGESINVSHILLQPKPSAEEQVKSIEFLDSVRQVILTQKIEFSDAALKFSQDANKIGGGWVINPYSLSTKFDQESLDQTTFATISKLIQGEYSSPVIYQNDDGIISYRLIYLKSKVAPHTANIVEDYDIIKNAAIEEKKNNVIQKWLTNKVKVTSIKIADKYKSCEFVSRWQIP